MIFQNIPEPIDELLRVLGYWDHIFTGFIITLWLYGWSLLFGFVLGLFLSILRTYGNRFISPVATAYIDLMRGTPLIAQLLLIYFLPYSLNIPISNWSLEANFMMFDKNIAISSHRNDPISCPSDEVDWLYDIEEDDYLVVNLNLKRY